MHHPAFLPALMAALLGLGSLQAAEPRTWTSRDGSARLTATFHKADANSVTLLLPNGRAQVVHRQFLSADDLAWIDAQASGEPAPVPESAAAPSAGAPIPAALQGNLIDDRGRSVDLARDGVVPKYYLFYYSASWCGPCVAYTPEVIRVARRLEKDSFTVVLVPADRSVEEQVAYMKNHRMPWPGLRWSERGYRGIPPNPGNSIPAARLTDAAGTTLLTTKDVSRDTFLEEVEKIVEGKASPKTAAN